MDYYLYMSLSFPHTSTPRILGPLIFVDTSNTIFILSEYGPVSNFTLSKKVYPLEIFILDGVYVLLYLEERTLKLFSLNCSYTIRSNIESHIEISNVCIFKGKGVIFYSGELILLSSNKCTSLKVDIEDLGICTAIKEYRNKLYLSFESGHIYLLTLSTGVMSIQLINKQGPINTFLYQEDLLYVGALSTLHIIDTVSNSSVYFTVDECIQSIVTHSNSTVFIQLESYGVIFKGDIPLEKVCNTMGIKYNLLIKECELIYEPWSKQ